MNSSTAHYRPARVSPCRNKNKAPWYLCLYLLAALFSIPGHSATFRIGLEPFPPLITADRQGMTVRFLQSIEQRLPEHHFKIMIMPYNRAKKELKEGRLDMIGHTPYQKETQDFYEYAEEIHWSIAAPLDIYSIQRDYLEPEVFSKLNHIGTPRGNEDFLAELLGLSPKQFFAAGNIDNLVEMMGIGRIPAFIFARAPTVSMIQKLDLRGIYYRNLVTLHASLAVSKTASGQQLQALMEEAIEQMDVEKWFHRQYHYNDMAEQGIVPVSITHP
ncbi:hypothetical protein HMF8227_01710 [Saliniradius amylolyticus]|uniref:Solute-binding protein family 3/N-terminal domain-containing protein n=1 Tax=Saliniradius amylolyticus TaxID=2183582 RepID=A0A2S2E3G7_9ALTE|nr:hypothetical protein [Saliniradius amylolyticus]AWL12183.1 hypothetical protein HMF8227_01710 [Saliniradius amylolyticus]